MGLASHFQALVIGVGDYINFPGGSLPATIKDALCLASVLKDPKYCCYPQDRVHILTGKNATRENILNKLKLLSRSRATNATTLVYFSGHGGRIGSTVTSGPVYLLPYDTNPYMIRETAISGEELSTALSRITTGRLVTILDACYSDGVARLKSAIPFFWKEGLPNTYIDDLSKGTGSIVMSSSREDQKSLIIDDMSIFTKYIIKGLKGAARVEDKDCITVLDLFRYAKGATLLEYPGQEPQNFARNIDMDFPIALVHKKFNAYPISKNEKPDSHAQEGKIPNSSDVSVENAAIDLLSKSGLSLSKQEW